MALNLKALGIAGGAIWGIGIFLVALLSSFTGFGQSFIDRHFKQASTLVRDRQL